MESTTPSMPEGEKLYGKLPPGLGEWLFKEKDQVLGPVPPEMLLTKLYEGSVQPDTPVATEIGAWKPLREVWFLGAHVPRAQQRTMYLQAHAERQATESRHVRTRVMMGAAMFALLFVVSLGAARWTMIERPWEDKTDWLTRRPGVVTLPDRTPKLAYVPPAAAQTDPTPPPSGDPSTATTPGAIKPEQKEHDKKGGAHKAGKGKEKDKDAAKPVAAAAAAPEKPKEDDGLKTEGAKGGPMPQELSNEVITATFKAGAGGYTSCIKEEALRNPEMPSTITIEFVIRNDGTTAEFKVQEKEIRTGPLATCMGAKIAALRFPKFSGERKFFQFPFKITRRK